MLKSEYEENEVRKHKEAHQEEEEAAAALAAEVARAQAMIDADARAAKAKKGKKGTGSASASASDNPLDGPLNETSTVSEDLALNELHVTLLGARGLVGVDKSLFSSKATSDPMVTIKAGGHVAKSTVKKKTLSPSWNETFKLQVGVS